MGRMGLGTLFSQAALGEQSCPGVTCPGALEPQPPLPLCLWEVSVSVCVHSTGLEQRGRLF